MLKVHGDEMRSRIGLGSGARSASSSSKKTFPGRGAGRSRCLRFGGLQADEVRRLKALEAENARLKKLVAERDLAGLKGQTPPQPTRQIFKAEPHEFRKGRAPSAALIRLLSRLMCACVLPCRPIPRRWPRSAGKPCRREGAPQPLFCRDRQACPREEARQDQYDELWRD
jgi:hypothetical protein